jgi:hypothetical protein
MRSGILISVVSLLLAGATSNGCVRQSAHANQPITIVFAHAKHPKSAYLSELVGTFEQQNPGIRVREEVLPSSSDQQHQYYVINLAARARDVDVFDMDVLNTWACAASNQPMAGRCESPGWNCMADSATSNCRRTAQCSPRLRPPMPDISRGRRPGSRRDRIACTCSTQRLDSAFQPCGRALSACRPREGSAASGWLYSGTSWQLASRIMRSSGTAKLRRW